MVRVWALLFVSALRALSFFFSSAGVEDHVLCFEHALQSIESHYLRMLSCAAKTRIPRFLGYLVYFLWVSLSLTSR